MVVTFATAHCRTEKNLRRVADSVGHVLGKVFLCLGPAFAGRLKQHVEA